MVEGKNIVVTGALQGIGKQTMTTLAQHGANVIACAYKEDEEFSKYIESLSSENHVSIYPVYFDMMDNDSIKAAAREIQKLKLDIHGLVNIAGINRDAYFNMVTMQDLQDTFQVNFFSQILFTQYIVKLMLRKQTKGSIAFTSSVSALDGNAGQTSYAASKAALIGAMRTMAIELGSAGLRVNAVAPWVIKTPMTDALAEDVKEGKVARMDIQRLGKPEEVADTFMYLMSDLSSHVTGQTIRIDGGMR